MGCRRSCQIPEDLCFLWILFPYSDTFGLAAYGFGSRENSNGFMMTFLCSWTWISVTPLTSVTFEPQTSLEPQSQVPVDYFMLTVVLIPFHCNLQKAIKADCPKQPLPMTLCKLFTEELTFEVTKMTRVETVPIQPVSFSCFASHEIIVAFRPPSLWYPAERPVPG